VPARRVEESLAVEGTDGMKAFTVVRTVADLRRAVDEFRSAGRTIGMVPTMGALHHGHTSLVQGALDRGDVPVASIFVNPSQFGPNEDFAAYPRDEVGDFAMLAAAGCCIAYAPGNEEMYPGPQLTTVTVASLTDSLCGPFRPGHFQGVATVVCKLLMMAMPDRGYFGEKDYQQLQVLKRMARDLAMPVEIVGMPTIREPDGLAMSSRNRRLAPGERKTAVAMHRELKAAGEDGRRWSYILHRGSGEGGTGAAGCRIRQGRLSHRRRCREPRAHRTCRGADTDRGGGLARPYQTDR
jgi:pantoate--beta-alanine ligase